MEAVRLGVVLVAVLCSAGPGSAQNPSTIGTAQTSQTSSSFGSDAVAAVESSSTVLPGWPGGTEPSWNALRVSYGPLSSSEASLYSTTVGDTGAEDQSGSTYQATDSSSSSTWAPDNPNFDAMPRTVAEAASTGWTRLATSGSDLLTDPTSLASAFDDSTSTPWCGIRVQKASGDKSVILIYDKKGLIVGIQSGIKNDFAKYGFPAADISPPLIEWDGYYYMTAYFVPPSEACSDAGRLTDIVAGGTGSGLWVQNSAATKAGSVFQFSMEESAVAPEWKKGPCLPGMGVHYWYNSTYESMDCDKLLPFFLMYNRGKLTGFGWAFGNDFPGSYYEHPTAEILDFFFPQPVATCLRQQPIFSTLHIFLTNTAAGSNICNGLLPSSTLF